ncbi:uncharacterized protein LOC135397560 [Ornithodoros turicata]|uniref:uncharacterized protein LOC135397560 n=1 Tax=Ornithodoros turicata TaxID=34597 RepID=UPI003138C4E5
MRAPCIVFYAMMAVLGLSLLSALSIIMAPRTTTRQARRLLLLARPRGQLELSTTINAVTEATAPSTSVSMEQATTTVFSARSIVPKFPSALHLPAIMAGLFLFWFLRAVGLLPVLAVITAFLLPLLTLSTFFVVDPEYAVRLEDLVPTVRRSFSALLKDLGRYTVARTEPSCSAHILCEFKQVLLEQLRLRLDVSGVPVAYSEAIERLINAFGSCHHVREQCGEGTWSSMLRGLRQ